MIRSLNFRTLALIIAILLIGISVFLAFSRARTTSPLATPRSQLMLREGSWYRVGESTPFSGVMFETYPSGGRKSRAELAYGRLEGLSEGWYTNGQRQVLEHFHAGVSHGLRTKWHPNGRKLSEVQIVEGKLEGTFRRWNQDGTLYEEIQMANGKAEGISRAYYPSGFLRTEARLHDGEVVNQEFWKDGEQAGAPLAAIGGK